MIVFDIQVNCHSEHSLAVFLIIINYSVFEFINNCSQQLLRIIRGIHVCFYCSLLFVLGISVKLYLKSCLQCMYSLLHLKNYVIKYSQLPVMLGCILIYCHRTFHVDLNS